jgi:hypothetical protein
MTARPHRQRRSFDDLIALRGHQPSKEAFGYQRCVLGVILVGSWSLIQRQRYSRAARGSL